MTNQTKTPTCLSWTPETEAAVSKYLEEYKRDWLIPTTNRFFSDELLRKAMLPKLPYKKLSCWAETPTKNHEDDAAYDLYASESVSIAPGQRVLIDTGIALAIPSGYSGFIWDRSGMGAKHGIHRLAGVIDASYRGEIKVCLLNTNSLFWAAVKQILTFGLCKPKPYEVKRGDRIAQITIQPTPQFHLVESSVLDLTERGGSGFGSSGR